MTLWMVRAGKNGEQENVAIDNELATIGWDELPDLSGIETRHALSDLLEKTYPNEKKKTLQNWLSQIWMFIHEMKEKDLVALPLKSRSAIKIGEVAGSYHYRTDLLGVKHTRPVRWIKEFPRSAFEQDLLFSFGAFMTVCRIQRNNAEERVRALLIDKSAQTNRSQASANGGEVETDPPKDLEQFSLDQIRDFIARKFKGHDLARLVGAVLEVQGYKLRISPAGPDGGVDIIAGYGPMGFDYPRMVVQVKSGDSPVDIKVIRELQGVMKNHGAEQGLVVAWGGYTNSVHKEAARYFFEVRLWDADDLIKAVLECYEKLPENFKTELPLKKFGSWFMMKMNSSKEKGLLQVESVSL